MNQSVPPLTLSGIAEGYDAIASRIGMSPKFYTAFLQFADGLELPLLDLGSGRGLLLEEVGKRLGKLDRCYGADISHQLCLLCRQRVGVHVVQCDAQRLPFPSKRFRTLLCTEVLEHVLEPVWMFGEVRRVLEEGGSCHLSVPNRDWPRYERYQAQHRQVQPVDDRFYRLSELEVLAAETGLVVSAVGGYGSIRHGGIWGALESFLARWVPRMNRRRKRLFVSLRKKGPA